MRAPTRGSQETKVDDFAQFSLLQELVDVPALVRLETGKHARELLAAERERAHQTLVRYFSKHGEPNGRRRAASADDEPRRRAKEFCRILRATTNTHTYTDAAVVVDSYESEKD